MRSLVSGGLSPRRAGKTKSPRQAEHSKNPECSTQRGRATKNCRRRESISFLRMKRLATGPRWTSRTCRRARYNAGVSCFTLSPSRMRLHVRGVHGSLSPLLRESVEFARITEERRLALCIAPEDPKASLTGQYSRPRAVILQSGY